METGEILQQFGDLPFTLELEIGGLAMTIREIFELREGAVFRTGHPAGTPFKLVTGGVQLGEAEMVVVDDSVSIRVGKLSQNTKTSTSDDGTN